MVDADELRSDIARLWVMVQELKADFISVQTRYLEIEEERRTAELTYYTRVHEVRSGDELKLQQKVERLEKIIQKFSEVMRKEEHAEQTP